MSALTEAQQAASLDAKVELWTLDGTSHGAGVLRWTSGTVSDQPVVFAGNTYPPTPIEADGFEWSGSGPLPTPRLRIANVNLVITGLLQQFNDLVGATVTRLRTLTRFLDGQPGADPTAHWPLDVYRVERKSAQNKVYVEWELAAAMDQEGRLVPGRQVTRLCDQRYRVWDPDTQTFDYSQATCPYVGAASFDRFGNPVASGADDVCNKQLTSGCKVRFGDNAILPFRGFPGVARARV